MGGWCMNVGLLATCSHEAGRSGVHNTGVCDVLLRVIKRLLERAMSERL